MTKRSDQAVAVPLLASDLGSPGTRARFERAARRIVRSSRRLADFDPEHHVEELVQDALLKAHQYLSNGGHVRNRDAFIYTTLRNLYRDRLKRQGRRPFTLSLSDAGLADANEPEAPGAHVPVLEVDKPDDRVRVDQLIQLVIRSLPPTRWERRRSVFLLSLDGYRGADMAEILEVSRATISGDLAVVRAAIRKALLIPHYRAPDPR